jgi:hypothetical protein
MSEEMKARLIQFLAEVKPYFTYDIYHNDDCIEGSAMYRQSVELLEELEFLTKELNNDRS